MLLEDTEFPIVWMHYNRTDPRGDEASFLVFDNLLGRKQPFVLIGIGAVDDHEHSAGERKQVTLWMKRNREALRNYVRAMVYIEPSPARRFVAKASTTVFEKFWGYPMLVAASENEALAIAGRLLNGEEASALDVGQSDA